MSYIERENGRKIYFEHHAGSKTPVMLIHGWGTSCRVWDTTLVALRTAGHTVVAFDQRGCGQSDKDFAANTIALGAEDAVAILDHLGIRRAVLNGWSLGGAIAVETAARLGSRCAGLVLTAAASPRYVQAPDYPHGGAPGSATATVDVMRKDRANFFDALTKAVCAEPQSQAMHIWMWSQFMLTSPCADHSLAELDVVDQRATLAKLDVPVLSVVGAKDVVVAPDVCRSVAQYAKVCQVVEFEACGHAPFIEDGERYREAVLGFLGSLG
jgi:pimeloyl-[acyl-carrier protein] methyl ester esterase